MTPEEYKALARALREQAFLLPEEDFFTTKRTLENLATVSDRMALWKQDNPNPSEEDPGIWNTACGCG